MKINQNDGKTAVWLFKNAEISSEITKLNLGLIKRVHLILIVLLYGHVVNGEKFRDFAHNTVRHFLFTGRNNIQCPFANWLSEEAQEAT